MAGLDSYVKLYANFNSLIQDDYGGKTLSGNGSASISTSVKKFGAGSLLLASATSDFVNITDDADFNLGSGDFTFDLQVRFVSLPSSSNRMCLFSSWNDTTDEGYMLSLYNNAGRYELEWKYTTDGSTEKTQNIDCNIVIDTFYHIAVCRDSTDLAIFLDGECIGGYYVGTDTIHNSAEDFKIGAYNTTETGFFNGYIDEFRFSKGIARYTVNSFTPTTVAFTDDADTALLLHMDGADDSTTFTDSSSNGFSATVVGNSKLKTSDSFGKFGTGVGKFDNSGDYLSIPDHADWSFGNGDFTIDVWIYPNSLGSYETIVSNRSSASDQSFSLYTKDNNRIRFGYSFNGSTWYDLDFVVPATLQLNTWQHIAIVRNTTTLYCYLDGAQSVTTGSVGTNSFYDGSGILSVGQDPRFGLDFGGYMDELRISKGVARWTTGFTPPSSAYSSDANTSLLLHMDGSTGDTTFTDSGNTGHTVTANGDAQIQGSFTLSPKIGTACGKFDGSGDYIYYSDDAEWNFSNSNFAIESYIYLDNLPTDGNIYGISGQCYSGTGNLSYILSIENTSGVYSLRFSFSYNGSTARTIICNYDFSFYTWYHISVFRVSDTVFVALNGNILSSYYVDTNSVYNSSEVLVVASRKKGLSGITDNFSGYLDEFRISNTTNRYTPTSFSVPVAEYSTADVTAPTVLTLSPANGASNVEPDANLVITFDENVTAVASKYIQIKKSSDNSLVESIEATNAKVTVSGAEVTINPAATLDYNTRYYVVVDVGAFKDASSNNFAGILGTTSWTFRIRKIEVAGIFEVLEYQSTESSEAGTTTTNVTITDHGMVVGDFIVNTTRRGTDAERGSRRITAIVDDDNFTVTAITGQTTSDSIRLYKFVDRTNKVKTQTARCTLATQGMRTLSLMLVTTSSWMPIVGQYCRFSITQDSVTTRYFLGTIQQIDTMLATGNLDVGGGTLFMGIQATNLNTIPTRRTIQVAYDSGDNFGTIVEEMVDDYLIGDGITKGTIDTGAQLDEDWYDDVISISDVLDRAATESGFQWFIDENGALQFYDEPGSFTNADYNIDETSSAFTDYFGVRISSNLDQYLNKQFIMGGTDERGNPVIISSEDFTESTAMQNVTAGTGVFGTIIRDTGIEGSSYVSAAVGTTTTNVTYTSHNQEVGDMFWNLTRNEYRLVTAVVDANNFTVDAITSQTNGDIIVFFDKANDIIQNAFKVSGRINYKLQFKTRYVGFEAGHKMTINLPTLGISNETFLIETVEISDLSGRQDGDGGWLSVVTCTIKDSSNFTTKRLNNYVDFWANF